MADSRNVPHPNLSHILCPNTDRFVWVSNKGFAGFKRQVDLLLDGCKDTAHVHITNILNNERSKAPASDEDKSSSEESEDSVSDHDTDKEDETDSVDRVSFELGRVEGAAGDEVNAASDVDAMIVDSEEYNSNDDTKTFEELCYELRQANDDIREAIRAGNGVSHVHVMLDINVTN
jgi:hypothetical protein